MERRGRNPQDSRLHNRSLILTVIRNEQAISRADIARQTRLSKPVVTDIVEELIRNGLVKEGVKGESPQGRKPIMLELNTSSAYVVGVDLARAYIEVVVTDLSGASVGVLHRDVSWDEEVTRYASETLNAVRDAIREARIEKGRVIGVGLGFPSPLSLTSRITVPPPGLPGWRSAKIREALEEDLGVPVFSDNDANAAALHEAWFGHGSSFSDYLFILVGTGVGCGVVVNGQVLRGIHGMAGEIAHMSLNAEGPRCECGSRGCLEMLVSEEALASSYLACLAAGAGASTGAGTGTRQDARERPGLRRISALACEGDPCAVAAAAQTGTYLGWGVASIVNVFDPEAVVIGGAMAALGEPFIEAVRRAVSERAHPLVGPDVRVLVSRHKANVVARGAATLVLQNFFTHPQRYVRDLGGARSG